MPPESDHVIRKSGPEERTPVELAGGGLADVYDYPHAKVRMLSYPAGSEIPAHTHPSDALHIIIKGRIRLKYGDIELAANGDYQCGGFEYGPWNVLEALQMLVIEPKEPFPFPNP